MGDSFTHLHVHTEFSMLDGAAKLDELVAKAVADGQPALGMTDHGNMYGVLDFYKAAKDVGVKPSIGSELYQAYDDQCQREGVVDFAELMLRTYELMRDNDALRPTDPTRRKESGKGTASGESTAQETADNR